MMGCLVAMGASWRSMLGMPRSTGRLPHQSKVGKPRAATLPRIGVKKCPLPHLTRR